MLNKYKFKRLGVILLKLVPNTKLNRSYIGYDSLIIAYIIFRKLKGITPPISPLFIFKSRGAAVGSIKVLTTVPSLYNTYFLRIYRYVILFTSSPKRYKQTSQTKYLQLKTYYSRYRKYKKHIQLLLSLCQHIDSRFRFLRQKAGIIDLRLIVAENINFIDFRIDADASFIYNFVSRISFKAVKQGVLQILL